jgi:SET domain-containing protein
MSLAQVAKYEDKNVKDYVFQIVSGPDTSSTFAVYPKDFASTGFFMNHSSKTERKNKINVKASISITKHGPIILLQALRKIKIGEELLYNYNGKFDSFNTTAF